MLELLFQDDDVVAVNKASGLLVHRGWANDKKVVMTELRDQIGQWVYPVHRLDRGTSGVLLFGLSSQVAARLCLEFSERKVQKRYLALVRGVPADAGEIDHPVPKDEGGERVAAVTTYRRLATVGRYSLVEARPATGRLHQIRRHLKHISCPIIGDVRYGKGEHNRHFREVYGLHRLALHCASMALRHPVSGEALQLEAPIPDELRRPWSQLGVL